MAPRLVYVASAAEDSWADPLAEFDSCREASSVYNLLGVPGLVTTCSSPSIGSLSDEGRIGYHFRAGKHNLTREDWEHFLDFAQRHWANEEHPERQAKLR
jgi:hypothetical protein